MLVLVPLPTLVMVLYFISLQFPVSHSEIRQLCGTGISANADTISMPERLFKTAMHVCRGSFAACVAH